LDLTRERGRNPFIGIDREHPFAARKGERVVLLRPKPLEDVNGDARTFFVRDLRSAVVTAAVDQETFVAEGERVEALGDVGGLVLGDDDRAQLRHWGVTLLAQAIAFGSSAESPRPIILEPPTT